MSRRISRHCARLWCKTFGDCMPTLTSMVMNCVEKSRAQVKAKPRNAWQVGTSDLFNEIMNKPDPKFAICAAFGFPFSDLLRMAVDELLWNVLWWFHHIVMRVSIPMHHILPLAASASVSVDMIDGILLQLISLIFALTWLVLAFSKVFARSIQ